MNNYCKHSWFVYRAITISLLMIINFFVAYGHQVQTEIIAHRGYWKALPTLTQNSRASLQAAIDERFYGSETDLWITKDDVLIINHDGSFKGHKIEESTYAELQNLKLSNGETIPTLDDFLSILRDRTDSPTKLIIEIKSSNTGREIVAAEKTVAMVSSFDVENRVEYISFSYGVCKKIKEISPESEVYYLSTAGREPKQLVSDGIFMNYECDVWKVNPSWIDEAHLLNLKTNVWTVDNRNQIYDFISWGIDYITTNNPFLATQIRNGIGGTSGIRYDDINNYDNEIVYYYDLYGRRIKNPSKGQMILQINENGLSKLIIY